MIDAKNTKLLFGAFSQTNLYGAFHKTMVAHVKLQLQSYNHSFINATMFLQFATIVVLLFTTVVASMNLEARQRLIDLIKKLRGNESYTAFGKRVEVSYMAVSKWETGQSIPDREHLSKIAKLAGYSLDELLAYLEGTVRKKSEKIPLSRLITEASQLNTQEVTALYRAVSDRLVAIAESAGR
jgi:transcriptional regulator with XRE-family HTH domain